MDAMQNGSCSSRQVLWMAFGLPVLTTVIVVGSMYAGHVMTTRSDRPTNVMVSAATPRIDVNVPQAAPPSVLVSTPPATVDVHVPQPQVDVHVPQSAPPTVTFNAPPMPAPNITVSPAVPLVTVIREESAKEKVKEPRAAAVEKIEKPAPATPAPGGPFVAPADSAKSAEPKTSASTTDTSSAVKTEAPAAKPADAVNSLKSVRENLKSPPQKLSAPPGTNGQSSHSTPETKPTLVSRASSTLLSPEPLKAEDLSLDTLYACATQYIDAYCKKNGLSPASEERKWNKTWHASVEQAISDNIDSTEQSYINRMVLAKRDYFNIEKASPEKIVEACRIMLRYRDGQLAWLSAMREALTEDNLKRTVAFLSAGPK